MSFCTECGTRLGAEARFCASCGAAQTVTPSPEVLETALAAASANVTTSGAAEAKTAPPVTIVQRTWGDVRSEGTPPPSLAQPETTENLEAVATGSGTSRATTKLTQLAPAQITEAAADGLRALAAVSGVPRTMSYCPGCGTPQEPNTPFCVHCGRPLGPRPALTDPQPQSPDQAAGPATTSASTAYRQPGPAQPVTRDPAGEPAPAGQPTVPLPPDSGPDEAAPASAAQDLQSRWASTRPATMARGPLVILALALIVLLAGAGAVYALMNHQRPAATAVAATPSKVVTPSAAPIRTTAPNPAREATLAPNAAAAAAAAAAKQISALLDDSSQARGIVGAATSGLAGCTLSADQAVTELQSVVANRLSLLNQLDKAPFEALPAGAALRSSLTAAWGASLSADQGYLSWARNAQASGTCPSDTANVSADNIRATEAKKTFATLWNTKVSTALHLPTRNDTDL